MIPFFFPSWLFKVFRPLRLAALDKSKRRDAFKMTPTEFLKGCCYLELRLDEHESEWPLLSSSLHKNPYFFHQNYAKWFWNFSVAS